MSNPDNNNIPPGVRVGGAVVDFYKKSIGANVGVAKYAKGVGISS